MTLRQWLASPYPPILAYHHIVVDAADLHCSDCSVTIRQFEVQMDYLYRHGYCCAPVSDLLCPDAKFPKNTFILTFDDGFEDLYTCAYPILRRYSFTATIFLVTDFIQGESNWDGERNSPMLTWDQVQELHQAGIAFGCHTGSHPSLVDLQEDQARGELIRSKQVLEACLGSEVTTMAYPFGDSNPVVRGMVAQAGFQAAFGVITGEPGRFNIWRIEPKASASPLIFALQLTRWFAAYLKLRGWVRENTAVGRFLRDMKHRYRSARRMLAYSTEGQVSKK